MKFNRKGFTLIELLAVVVILGVVIAVVLPSITGVLDGSKKKSEEIFVNKLSKLVDDYVELNTSNLRFDTDNSVGDRQKCKTNNTDCVSVPIYKLSGTLPTVQSLVDGDLIDSGDLINPNGAKKCNSNATIEIYRDSDYVYCHKVNLDCVETKDASGNDTYDIDTCGA